MSLVSIFAIQQTWSEYISQQRRNEKPCIRDRYLYSLSFVPKVVLVIFAMGLFANFFIVSLTDYFTFIFETIQGIK